MRVQYVACVFCGRTKPLTAGAGAPFTGRTDPLRYKVLQVREQHPRAKGKGKSLGFTVRKSESLTIAALTRTRPELVAQIKQRLLTILAAYRQAGILGKEELAALMA